MTGTRDIAVTINGIEYKARISERLTLADYLRHEVGLRGTHLGCEHGVCGACTVLVDGQSARSCLMLAVQADRRMVTTVEGLTQSPGKLNALQQAFRDHHALQCGFCTPGILIEFDRVDRE